MKIGVVATDFEEGIYFGIKSNYLDFAARFGTPTLLTPVEKETFIDFYKLDALILPGGSDVDPKRYNAIPGYWLGKSSPYMEFFDTEILPKLIGKIPIFGICRGLQTLNVHFGGTLRQHLYTHLYSFNDDDLVHKVETPSGKSFKVNSFHHQGILKLANNFKIEASSKDNVIEAISDYSKRIFAVQWHPERSLDAFSLAAFARILEA